MEIYYTQNKLYINIEDRINFSLIYKLQRKLYRILDEYKIANIVINILSNEHYDMSLIDDLINDYKSKYNGSIIVR